MAEPDDIKSLLVDIRDLQREHLAEYRRVTQRSVELQERSVARQEQFALLYRRIVTVGLLLIVFIVGIIVLLISRFLP